LAVRQKQSFAFSKSKVLPSVKAKFCLQQKQSFTFSKSKVLPSAKAKFCLQQRQSFAFTGSKVLPGWRPGKARINGNSKINKSRFCHDVRALLGLLFAWGARSASNYHYFF
jgi:hypothetical protein